MHISRYFYHSLLILPLLQSAISFSLARDIFNPNELIQPDFFSNSSPAFQNYCSTPSTQKSFHNKENGCPKWIYKDLPLCPSSGVTMLSDDYPAIAHVLPGRPVDPIPLKEQIYKSTDYSREENWSRQAKNFHLSFVEAIEKTSGNRPPLVVLPTPNFIYQETKAGYIFNHPNSSFTDQLIPAPFFSNHTFVQDVFETSFDPNSGKGQWVPILNKASNGIDIETEDDRIKKTREIMKALSEVCPDIAEGKALIAPGSVERLGAGAGGNIESLPGGLCLSGSNQSDILRDQYCGKEENKIIVDVSWLSVGHADEIVSVQPTGSRAGKCNFVVTIASIEKSLELLEKNPDVPFFGESKPLTRTGGNKNREFLCSRLDQHKKSCSPTNGEVLKLSQTDKKWKPYLDLLRQVMTNNQKKIVKKLKERHQHCDFDVIEMPVLYGFRGSTGMKINKGVSDDAPVDQKYRLANKRGFTLLPNPVNKLSTNAGSVYSKTHNPVFDAYIETEFKRVKTRSESIDTLPFLQMGGGDLHCATQTIRVCKPIE